MNKLMDVRPYLTIILALVLAVAPVSTSASSVESSDSVSIFDQPVELDGLVVRANRIPLTELRIPASATVLHLNRQNQRATATTSGVIARLSGLRAYPSGNRWGQANVDVRGFAGGGQAHYMKVTYDGIPINQMASGLVSWTMIDPLELDRVEAISGPVSAQYGDFGFGGLLALTSRWLPTERNIELAAGYGSFDAGTVNAQATGRFKNGRAHLSLSGKRSDGWRRHSRFEAEKAGVKLQRTLGNSGDLTALFSYSHTNEELPGAVDQQQLDSAYHDAARDLMGNLLPDASNVKEVLAGLSADFTLNHVYELKTRTYLTSLQADRTVTVLVPVNSDPELLTIGAEASLGMKRQLGGRLLHLVTGTSFEYGRLETRWTEYAAGREAGGLVSAGTGERIEVAWYGHGIYYPTKRLQLSLGLRVDHIRASFDAASSAVSEAGRSDVNENTAVSPKVGLGIEITPTITAFASVSGAFKSPTLLHLYDSPPYPLPPEYGGGWTLISNEQLEPQKGVCYEAGVKLIDSDTRLTASYYLYDITSEIDFSPSEVRYDNIGESSHQGFELCLSRQLVPALSVHGSLETISAEFSQGENDGNQINGVPKHRYALGFAVRPISGASVTVNSTGQDGLYLDAANEHEADGFIIVSLAADYRYHAVIIGLSVENLFDREYSHDGYIGLLGESRFYPGAPRSLMVTVSMSL